MEIRNLTRRKPCIVDGSAGMTDDDRGQFLYRKAAIKCVKELEGQLDKSHRQYDFAFKLAESWKKVAEDRKTQLDEVRGLCETSKCTAIPTKSEQGYEQMKLVYVVNRDVIMSIIAPQQALEENDE